MTDNRLKLEFNSSAENVAVARTLVAACASAADGLRLSELDEIKLAVSEAVSNAVIHGYAGDSGGLIELTVTLRGRLLTVRVADYGCGIADIRQALQPGFSADSQRMGLGFAFMQAMMDKLEVSSTVGEGTCVVMDKLLGEERAAGER